MQESDFRDSNPRFLIHEVIFPAPPTCHRGRFADGSRAPFAAVVVPAAPGRFSKGYPAAGATVQLLPRFLNPLYSVLKGVYVIDTPLNLLYAYLVGRIKVAPLHLG